MRVLVIEDDADVCHAIVTELADAGHEATAAADGAIALKRLLRQADDLPDVILLDLMMPDMDGKAFRVRQLAEPRLAAIPTLIITAKPLDRTTRSALGQVTILPKPFEPDVLLAAMEEVVQPRLAVKRCGCGRVYDEDSWQGLPIVGEVDNGREVGECLELRRCPCDSTLAWQLGPHAVSLPLLRVR